LNGTTSCVGLTAAHLYRATCRTLAVMATRRTGKGTDKTPAQLSLVGAQPDTRTATEKRKANLAKAREVREARRAAAAAEFGSGPTNLERYRAGEYPVTEWDNTEVARGRPRGIDGGLGGQFPNLTGKQQAEIKRELLRRGQRRMDGLFGVAVSTLADVAKNGENESARVKAATELMNRVAGKTPDRIEIKSSDPWQDILDDIMDDEVLQRVNEARVQADS
jgi:hypothetical protein